MIRALNSGSTYAEITDYTQRNSTSVEPGCRAETSRKAVFDLEPNEPPVDRSLSPIEPPGIKHEPIFALSESKQT
jgi:hypothetical protein